MSEENTIASFSDPVKKPSKDKEPQGRGNDKNLKQAENDAEERSHLVDLLSKRIEKAENPSGIQMSRDYFESFFGPSSVREDGTPRSGYCFMGFEPEITEEIKTVRIIGEPEEEE